MSLKEEDAWMQSMPDFMTPSGMLFYSVIVYIIVMIHHCVRRRTVENYIGKTMHQSMDKARQ